MALEVLDFAFVLFRCGARFERAQISPAFRFRVDLAGIQTIAAGLEFANHDLIKPGGISEYFISSRVPATDQSQRKV